MKDKKLVLKDILARLPYEVKCRYYDCCEGEYIEGTIRGFEREKYLDIDGVCISFENVKPYLRPMSGMTEEELKELRDIFNGDIDFNEWGLDILNSDFKRFSYLELLAIFDWLNAHHFDYRGLIEKDLAIAVTKENNPYKSIEK